MYLIHRRNEFRGNRKLVDELLTYPNATILTPYIPIELIGGDKLEAIKIQNVETKEEKVLHVQGAFPLVGIQILLL